jgi:hypothetical protein
VSASPPRLAPSWLLLKLDTTATHEEATLTCRYDLFEGTNELYSSGLTVDQKAHVDLVYPGLMAERPLSSAWR